MKKSSQSQQPPLFVVTKDFQQIMKSNIVAVFLPEAKLGVFEKSSFFKSLPEEAKAQFFSKKKDLNFKKPNSISVLMGHGGQIKIIASQEKSNTFDLHSLIRKVFSGSISSTKSEHYHIMTDFLSADFSLKVIEGFCSLMTLESWTTPKPLNEKKEESKKPSTLSVSGIEKSNELESAYRRGVTLAEATNLVRTLAETPSNFLKPNHYRELVEKRAKELGYKTEFYGVNQLEKMGAGAFLSVVKADPEKLGGILKLTYKPKATVKNMSKIALVGKGLCFDTGGYNVKTGSHMYGMHRDMTGSAVVLALFEALKKSEAPIELSAYLVLAENLISPHGTRPNDVVKAMNGLTIEVIDTDAEGRMALSDALVLASQSQPNLILDFATLTGAAVRALDTRIAAIFSNTDKCRDAGVLAGSQSGERAWGFPIGEDYFKKLESDVADTRQCASTNNCDHIYAATFLSQFIGKDIDWVHMDLTPDTSPGGLGLVKTECTGFGVRWGYEFIKNYTKAKNL